MCCDPFQSHTKSVSKGLRHISANSIEKYPYLGLRSSDKVCTACRKSIAALSKNERAADSSTQSDDEDGKMQGIAWHIIYW